MEKDDSKAVKRLKPVVRESDSSPMRKMMKMMEEHKDLLSLSAGEANFDPPEQLINLAIDAMRKDKNRYTSTNGIPEIREAVARFVYDQWGVKVDPGQNILMTVGGMEAIFLAARIVLEKGDRVLLPDPGWGVMRTVVERLGAVIDYYPLREEEQWIIRQMGIFKESISLCSFSIGQWAMSEFLPVCKGYLQEAREFCRKNMEMLVEGLQAIPGVRCTPPLGGLYVFPDFSEIEPSSQELFKRLLNAGVAVAPGAFFGSQGEGRARLMFACPPERIEKGLERIRAALDR